MVKTKNSEKSLENTKQKSLRDRKKLQTRLQIINSAKELFSQKNYDDVSIDDIAEYSVLSRTTVYNYFNTKEEIYIEIGIQGLEEIYEKQQSIIKTEMSGIELIIKLSRNILNTYTSNPLSYDILRYYLQINTQAEIPAHKILKKLEEGEKIDDFNSILRAKYLQTLNKAETCWIFAFKRGYKDKSVRQDIKMEHLIHFIVMVISGIVDRANLEKIPLEKMKLTTEMLIEMCVELIQKYLT